jgi:hypothetical protein
VNNIGLPVLRNHGSYRSLIGPIFNVLKYKRFQKVDRIANTREKRMQIEFFLRNILVNIRLKDPPGSWNFNIDNTIY